MTTRRVLVGFSLAAGCISALPAYADVEFNGFGQVVVGSTLGNSHSDFPNLNYTADPSFTPESLFALQVRAPLSPRLAATAQIVASGANGADFTPKFQWAYISYQASDAWTIKLGRQVDPIYKYSDYAAVGQAYNWLRPPPVVYQGINNIDGISFSGYYDLGDWNLQPQFVYGNLDTTASLQGQSVTLDFKNESIGNLVIGYQDWLTFRLGAAYSEASLQQPQLDAAIGALNDTCQTALDLIPNANPLLSSSYVTGCSGVPGGVKNSAVANELSTTGNETVFYSSGFEIDKNNFKLIAEGITSRFLHNELLPKTRAYYVSLGYQIGKFTPMLTFQHTDESSSAPGAAGNVNCGTPIQTQLGSLCGSGIPAPAADQLIPGITLATPTDLYVSNLVNGQRLLADYYEFGVRWDTSAKTAIKLDFTRYLNRSGTYYGLSSAGAGNIDPYTGVNLLSAAFVFVF